ncbi:MAG TPA: hypothetical protein VFL79_17640 [Terriglobia bacterium]|nr:hypothetical protein [Terriglobia bacterium]
MAKVKSPTVPDTHVLRVLAEEYLGMLAQARRDVKKLLTIDPQKEEFWDHLSEIEANITLIGSRSESIHEEIDELIDQLPDD